MAIGMGMGMGMGMAAGMAATGGALKPPPPPRPPPPPDFLSLSTSIRSASSPAYTSGYKQKGWVSNKKHIQCMNPSFILTNTCLCAAHPNHCVRFIGNVVVLGDFYQVALHQDLGRGLDTQFEDQL